MGLTQISTDGVKNDAISHNKIPANAVQASELADNAVDTAAIADDAVTGAKIANNAVGLAALADNAVDTAAIANNAVTNAKVASNAISTATIIDANVTTAKIADGAVTAAKIANDTITATQLATAAVNTGSIGGGAVTEAKLGASSVTTAKIADQAVTLAKLPHGTSSNDGKFLRANNGADPTFETVNTDLVADTSPQLGGDLDTNGHEISLDDGHFIKFGASNDMNIGHNTFNYITYSGASFQITGDNTNDILLRPRSDEISAQFSPNGAASLYYDNIKQLETTENGIKLPKGCIRGIGGSKVILGGTLDPSQDITWNFSFGTNDHGYNQGYIFNVKFYVNHWNTGAYYKYIESITGGRGNVTGLERVNLINNLGTGSGSWSSGHLDYSVSLSGGTRDGNNVSLFKVTYDADGAPGYTSGYYLEVSYGSQIGTISIT